MTNDRLIKKLKKIKALVYFRAELNCGIGFMNNENFEEANKFILKHTEQIKTITFEQWNTVTKK